MNLQYITDSNGQTTGVFIPIQDWNDLKSKIIDIEKEDVEVPDWHKELVRERMELYKNDPNQATDFDTSLDDIEKDL